MIKIINSEEIKNIIEFFEQVMLNHPSNIILRSENFYGDLEYNFKYDQYTDYVLKLPSSNSFNKQASVKKINLNPITNILSEVEYTILYNPNSENEHLVSSLKTLFENEYSKRNKVFLLG